MFWKEFGSTVKGSLVALLVLFTAFVSAGLAATTLYSGSFAVLTGGTYTDTNQTASSCAGFNASFQLTTATGCAFNYGTGLLATTNLEATAVTSANCVGTNSSGQIIANSACNGTGTGKFSSIATDGNNVPTNGWACGVANTTSCIITATTGATTTTGLTFNTTTACHNTGDTSFTYEVNSSSKLTFNCAGSLSSNGFVTAATNLTATNGYICAGSGSAFCATGAGFFTTSTSATAGEMEFGGSSSSAILDYGATTAGNFNFSAPVKITDGASGTLLATGSIFTNGGSLVAETGGCTTSLSGGDIGACRSTTTGAVFIGGSSANCYIDYNISNSNVLTLGNGTSCGGFVGTSKNAGNLSCTTSLSATCSSSPTATVGTAQCSVSYNGVTTASQANLLPIIAGVSGGILTATPRQSVATSVTFGMSYVCL